MLAHIMLQGVLRAHAIAEGGAKLEIDFGGALPVFQLLPCQEVDGAAAGEDGDGDAGWGDDY